MFSLDPMAARLAILLLITLVSSPAPGAGEAHELSLSFVRAEGASARFRLMNHTNQPCNLIAEACFVEKWDQDHWGAQSALTTWGLPLQQGSAEWFIRVAPGATLDLTCPLPREPLGWRATAYLFVAPFTTDSELVTVSTDIIRSRQTRRSRQRSNGRSNQSMELTASRRTTLFSMTPTPSPAATHALARSSSSCSR